MKRIALSHGRVALVDDEDFEWLSQWKWFFGPSNKRPGVGYAVRCNTSGKPHSILMHRALMERSHGPRLGNVSHKNGDWLDNRMSNLREATVSQRVQAGIKRAGTTSRYRGVSFSRHHKKWQAQIEVNGKPLYLGAFSNEEHAALAYNRAALEHYGEDARLNHLAALHGRAASPMADPCRVPQGTP